MVQCNESKCPKCGGELIFYDKVNRIVRTKQRLSYYILLRRLKCNTCRSIHREIPDTIFPYKQYESEIIKGVLAGYITSDILGFEDYPCELTMIRWTRNIQVFL